MNFQERIATCHKQYDQDCIDAADIDELEMLYDYVCNKIHQWHINKKGNAGIFVWRLMERLIVREGVRQVERGIHAI